MNQIYTISDLQDIINKAGSANDDPSQYGGEHKKDGLFLFQYALEYAEFLNFCILKGFSFDLTLAIGVAAGGEVKLFRDFVTCKRTIAIDLGNYYREHWVRIKPTVRTEFVEDIIDDSTSTNVKNHLEEEYQSQLDFAFIDGCHEHNYVKSDIETVKSIAHSGTLFTLHDIKMCPGAKAADDELYSDKNVEKLFETKHRYGIALWRIL